MWNLFKILLIGSTLLYAGLSIFFTYTYQQECEGDWGKGNPSLENKSGNGTCKLEFKLSARFISSKKPLLLWYSSYTGEWQKGTKHGYGTFIGFSGNTYQGEFQHDLRHGKGEQRMEDGTVYQGTWRGDSFTHPTDNKLKLHLKKSARYAPHVDLRFLNGSQYVGGVVAGEAEGTGILTFGALDTRKPTILKGRFHQGGYTGHGTIIMSDGTVLRVDRFSDEWSGSTYKADALLSTERKGKQQEIRWDGSNLIVDGQIVRSNHHMNVTLVIEQNKETDLYYYELYNALNTLKWFEHHFALSKPFLEAELYTFQQVDRKEETTTTEKDDL